MTKVYTTGQVARIFSVNINTVIKWFDDGKLNGFRLPRSNERRIYRESLVEFMSAHDISPDLLRQYDEQGDERRRGAAKRDTGSNGSKVGDGVDAWGPASARSGADLRVFPRKPVDLQARLRLSDDEHEVVTVRNLSMGGAYLTGLSAKRASIPAEFKLELDGDMGHNLRGTCQVVHLRRADDHSLVLGCRFTQVDPGSLQSYLDAV